MKVDEFFEWMAEVQKSELNLMMAKGKEYTVSDEDKLKNFKSIAERLKLSPEIVCMTYTLKHLDSIRNYILTGIESSSEPIDGRIMDARNYLLLLLAIIREKND